MKKQINQIPEEFRKPPVSIIGKGIKPTVFRFLIVSAIGFFVILLVYFLYGESPDPLAIPFIISIIAFNLISEGNIIINRILDKKSPWFFKISRRTRQQLAWSFLWTLLVGVIAFVGLPKTIYHQPHFFMSAFLVFIFGLIFVLLFNSTLFLKSFFLNWKKSVLEAEALKQAKLVADYKVLQNQLNPHFLFNSFSTLISEIHYNPETAIEFAQRLAEVYRYLLQKKNDLTVPVREELVFLKDFIFLHEQRMGNSLIVNINIPESYLEHHLPPMSLQLLTENAIKHNQASERHPLTIDISIKDEKNLSVCNNLQPKTNIHGTGTGLENISQRYEMLTGEPVKIIKTQDSFCVEFPLLFQDE
ncbi:sensor histidine kinase [Marinilabilia sp.]|uniref:sensor histidine kinase n=1 Tax=Marinilabilia sp. TaxID=2021252 RepID=UPI0025BCDDDD|nr:histidine kinase [Marinilabilia sp.]